MTTGSLALILVSAAIHVVAHVGLRRTPDRTAFVWWMLLWGIVLFMPVLYFNWQPVSWRAAGLMLVSAVFEAMYFAFIAFAYRTGDLSVVYPLARGTAPIFLLIWSTLGLGESPTAGGVAGIGVIALGLYVINLPRLGAWLDPLRALRQPAPRWALAAGVCISLYTVIDRVGIRHLDPLLYTYLALGITWAFLTLPTLRMVGWGGLGREWARSRWATVIAGGTSVAAYALVLYAMQAGTPASYAGAVREVSVVLGTAIGVFILKESSTPLRIAGAATVAAGVVLIRLAG